MDGTKIGFFGLGVMGGPMAVNMGKKGSEEIVAFVRDKHKAVKYVEQGIVTTVSVKEISEAAVIFLSLPDGDVVEEIVLGSEYLFRYLEPGQVIVDLSTSDYGITVKIGKALQEKGIHFLDAPVSGMEQRAIDGTLAVMCGGEREVFDAVRPYLERIGNTIEYMGETGSGQLVKLINQVLYDMNVASLVEMLALSRGMGLDPHKVGCIVNSGTGRRFASEFFIPRILKNEFSEGYPLEKAYKDIVSAFKVSGEMKLPLPVFNAAAAVFQAALLKGYGSENKGAMIKVYEELYGVEFRTGKTQKKE